jgi:hypothetical protein
MLENRVPKKIFGPKRDDVTGELRGLQNKELYDLYLSPNIIWEIKSRRMRWAGNVARLGERRGAYKVLVGKPERKRQVVRPRHRLEDNIKIDLLEVGWGDGMDWIDQAEDADMWRAVVNAVMILQVS